MNTRKDISKSDLKRVLNSAEEQSGITAEQMLNNALNFKNVDKNSNCVSKERETGKKTLKFLEKYIEYALQDTSLKKEEVNVSILAAEKTSGITINEISKTIK